MKKGVRIYHTKHGTGTVVGQSVINKCILIQYDEMGPNTCKVSKLQDLEVIGFSKLKTPWKK